MRTVGLWIFLVAGVFCASSIAPSGAAPLTFNLEYGPLLHHTTYEDTYSGYAWILAYFQDPTDPNDQRKVLFDATGKPTTLAKMLQTEQQAFFEQYGVFDPELDAVIRLMQPHETLDVGIWFKDQNQQVLPPKIARRVSLDPGQSIPLAYVTLTKADLILLRENLLIERIYLNQTYPLPEQSSLVYNSTPTPSVPSMYSAIRTQYIDLLWNAGFTGQEKTIGLVELGPVRHIPQLDVQGTQPHCNNYPPTNHATKIASIATSHEEPKGVAPASAILSSCGAGSDSELQSAIEWLFTNNADIANISLSYEVSAERTTADIIVNILARTHNKLIVVGAGNKGGPVGSPAKAWNVLSVGAYTDNNTLPWDDDAILEAHMFDNAGTASAFINPFSSFGDHEKPEVVAVGHTTTYANFHNQMTETIGTSDAAPQVAALATLLLNVHEQLATWPEALRAIIMASATHNLEGIHYIPSRTSIDLRDGAGGIVGSHAREIAESRVGFNRQRFHCIDSCWAARDDEDPVASTQKVWFFAKPGDRLRIVVSWWAQEPAYGNTVATDYDLRIKYGATHAVVATSNSADNNYEMVDFFPYQQGLYYAEIEKRDSAELRNAYGVAILNYRPLSEVPFNQRYKRWLPTVQRPGGL